MERVIESYLRYLSGDQNGLRDIIEQYWNSMLLFTNGYIHNLTDAEDIAQEALIKLSIKRPKFEYDAQLKSIVMIKNHDNILPVARGKKVYMPKRHFISVDLPAPFSPSRA